MGVDYVSIRKGNSGSHQLSSSATEPDEQSMKFDASPGSSVWHKVYVNLLGAVLIALLMQAWYLGYSV